MSIVDVITLLKLLFILSINYLVMITKELLIAFINVQETLEVQSVKANSKSLSFTAPRCYTSIIVDTFEPNFYC